MLENILIITGIVVVVAIIAVCIFRGNKSVVMRMLYAAVTEAEKEYGGGTGSLKLAEVISGIYPKLPGIIKAVVNEDILTDWVEEALDMAKDTWAKNANIAGYIEGNDGTKPE